MKTEILDILIKKAKENVQDVEDAIKSKKEAADIDENATKDMDDFSHQGQNNEIVSMLITQLKAAMTELEEVKSYRSYKNNDISPGALVETKDMYFVVGPSIRQGTYNDKKVVCISDESPVYILNQGLTAKDPLVIAGKNIKIISIS